MFTLRRNLPTAQRAFSTTSAAKQARMNIIGRLASQPEETQTSTGKSLVRYSVATNSGSSEKRTTSFFRIASFQEGPSKEYLLGVPKGSLVSVEADAKLRDLEDDQGNKQQRLDLVQRSFDLLLRFKGNAEGGEAGGQQ